MMQKIVSLVYLLCIERKASNVGGIQSWNYICSEQPIFPNPRIEQPNKSTLSLQWSPPFLWPGYFIKNYSISVSKNSNGERRIYQVNSVTFSEAVISFPLNESYHHCSVLTFGITPGHQDLTHQTHYITGGYYACELHYTHA